MAAASLARGSGVAGVPLLIFALLCLVCPASSGTNTEKLEKLKRSYTKAREAADRAKAKFLTCKGLTSGIMDDYMQMLEPLVSIMKETTPDSPPLLELMENIKTFVKTLKSNIDNDDEEILETFRSTEEKLQELKRLIQVLEGAQAEL